MYLWEARHSGSLRRGLVLFISVISLVNGQPWAPLLEDNTAILDVAGRSDVNPWGWGDSYSVGNACYCETSFDHDIDEIVVGTPRGRLNVRQVCNLLGPGPGSAGRPRYNDIQCGNGPANSAGDEDTCPGRIEHGQNGCKYIGPKWNFASVTSPTKAPARPPTPRKTPVRRPSPRVPVRTPNRRPPVRFVPTPPKTPRAMRRKE